MGRVSCNVGSKEFKDNDLVIRDRKIETVFAYFRKTENIDFVYIKKWREKTRRGGWENTPKHCFMDDVALYLALEYRVAEECGK